MKTIIKDSASSNQLLALADEVEKALKQHATVMHPVYGKIYAFEVDGFGSHNLMDDANVPGLLSLPYLGAVKNTDPLYVNTRRLLWSQYNPFFLPGSLRIFWAYSTSPSPSWSFFA